MPLIYPGPGHRHVQRRKPRANAFGEDDLQFAEIFSHEIAAALHTLELLSAEKSTTATQSIEAISREVALPVDDILAAATSVLDRYIGHDPDMADKLPQDPGRRPVDQADASRKWAKTWPRTGPPAAGPRPAPPALLKGLRVLVADNDERVRRSAHGLLGRWGCVVETARDGQEALTMARLGTYDAILADIRLPDVSGYEVYRQLREAQPLARVILMTAYGYDPRTRHRQGPPGRPAVRALQAVPRRSAPRRPDLHGRPPRVAAATGEGRGESGGQIGDSGRRPGASTTRDGRNR